MKVNDHLNQAGTGCQCGLCVPSLVAIDGESPMTPTLPPSAIFLADRSVKPAQPVLRRVGPFMLQDTTAHA